MRRDQRANRGYDIKEKDGLFHGARVLGAEGG